MNLVGFKLFDFSCKTPGMSLTKNYIAFDSSTTACLDYPEYIKIYISKEKSQIFVCRGQKGELGAIKYYTKGRKMKIVRITKKSLISELYKIHSELSDKFKIQGECLEDGILFDFKKSIQF